MNTSTQLDSPTSINQTQNHGSRTITITSSDDPSTTHSNHQSQPQSSVLILRAHPLINNPSQVRQTRVQWSENVIDNEGLGRKKSKVCCIYKKPRAFDESSDESDNSSDSDCCQHSSNSQPHPSNKSIPNNPSHSHSAEHRSSVRSSPPTAVNAYEAEPINSKGKGKA